MEDQNRIHDDSGAVVKPISQLGDFDASAPHLQSSPANSQVDSHPQSASQPEQKVSPIASHFVMTDPEVDSHPGSTNGAVQEIPIDQISANPYQPRKFFDPVKLGELAESIKFQGVIQPLVLTKSSSGYEILVGERRYRASLLAGLKTVPAIVRGEISDRVKLELALIENLQREDLNAIEEARAYHRLSEEFHLTQEQIAKKVGKSRPAVANVLRLLNLPAQIQRAVIEGQISEGHARALLSLENDLARQLEVYEWIVAENATVRDAENRVREIKNLPVKPYIRQTPRGKLNDPQIKQIEDTLRESLGTKVRLQKTGETGKIMIEFYSQEELAEIIKRLSLHLEENGGAPRPGANP
ncbi:MAG: ParB/RepB/Spo0J family partition protein [Patescibacteria group bacterium]|nr:ParB/RepB/Spo0J family partition protein [Patescibacteria group bacterium]